MIIQTDFYKFSKNGEVKLFGKELMEMRKSNWRLNEKIIHKFIKVGDTQKEGKHFENVLSHYQKTLKVNNQQLRWN